MEIVIRGEPKEIADLVREIQDRRTAECSHNNHCIDMIVEDINERTKKSAECQLVL